MIVIGPLIGLICGLGIPGLVAGRFVGTVVLRRAQHPERAARLVAWSWAGMLAGTGLALSFAAVARAQPDPLDSAVAVFFIWMFGVNAVTGSLAIRARVRRMSVADLP
jgi:hypothetical protein